MPRTKNWFVAALKTPSASASADAGLRVADVSIRGDIGDFGVTDSDFIAAIESFGEVDKIAVSLNTRGGAVDYALGIFNYLLNHPAPVEMTPEQIKNKRNRHHRRAKCRECGNDPGPFALLLIALACHQRAGKQLIHTLHKKETL